MVFGRLIRDLDRPVDVASCAAFRVLFGALLLVSTFRFLAHGWVAEYYRLPRLFFHYWGFAWIRPWPGSGMYLHYGVLLVAAAFILLGVGYRIACAVFAIGFGYAHFCDKATYLNHYYLITLLSGLCACLPLDRQWSLRVWRRPGERQRAGEGLGAVPAALPDFGRLSVRAASVSSMATGSCMASPCASGWPQPQICR